MATAGDVGFYLIVVFVAVVFLADQAVHALASTLNRLFEGLGWPLDLVHDIEAEPQVARAAALLPPREPVLSFADWTAMLHFANLRDAPPGYASQCDGLDDRRDRHRRLADYCEACMLLSLLSACHIGYAGEHARLAWVVAAAGLSWAGWWTELRAARRHEAERVALALLVARERLDREPRGTDGDAALATRRWRRGREGLRGWGVRWPFGARRP